MIAGFAPDDLAVFLLISLVICIVVCALAMEAAVLFTPSFLFVFPVLFPSFPVLSANEAIGLAFVVEVFGYTSSVTGYWYRGQVDVSVAGAVLAVTVPLAVAGRVASYVAPEDALLLAFGALLVGLAWIVRRYHPADGAGACLLCGDALGELQGGETLERDGGVPGDSFRLGPVDRGIVGVGGAFAGLIGIAIGEVSNTFLSVRKRVPIKLSTGTSALVLHVTILSALLTNLVLLAVDPSFVGTEGFSIPWLIGALLAPVVVLGGQIGSLLNNRLADRTVVRAMIGAYVLVGVSVIARVLTV